MSDHTFLISFKDYNLKKINKYLPRIATSWLFNSWYFKVLHGFLLIHKWFYLKYVYWYGIIRRCSNYIHATCKIIAWFICVLIWTDLRHLVLIVLSTLYNLYITCIEPISVSNAYSFMSDGWSLWMAKILMFLPKSYNLYWTHIHSLVLYSFKTNTWLLFMTILFTQSTVNITSTEPNISSIIGILLWIWQYREDIYVLHCYLVSKLILPYINRSMLILSLLQFKRYSRLSILPSSRSWR
jgi:hypothetical protein